jgi:hypothetical protein
MRVQPRLVPEKSPQQYRDLQMLIPRMAARCCPRELEHPAAQMDQFRHGVAVSIFWRLTNGKWHDWARCAKCGSGVWSI